MACFAAMIDERAKEGGARLGEAPGTAMQAAP
jgi:hypothetical protein